MAAGDYVGTAVGTLPVSGPGDISSVSVTVTGAASTSLVLVTPTNSISDAVGPFIPYVYSVDTNTVVLKVNRAQLPTAMTVRVMVWAGA